MRTTSDNEVPPPRDARHDALVGSRRLVWLELLGPDGALRRITGAKGSLIYTPTGQVSVQVMYASASDTPSSGPVQYALPRTGKRPARSISITRI